LQRLADRLPVDRENFADLSPPGLAVVEGAGGRIRRGNFEGNPALEQERCHPAEQLRDLIRSARDMKLPSLHACGGADVQPINGRKAFAADLLGTESRTEELREAEVSWFGQGLTSRKGFLADSFP
jgi:hypothetical protein